MHLSITTSARWFGAGFFSLVSLANAFAANPVGTREGSKAYLEPSLHVTLGPEQLVAAGAGWPYLVQTREGVTIVMGHHHWDPGKAEPIVFLTRSFDGRKTWAPWPEPSGC